MLATLAVVLGCGCGAGSTAGADRALADALDAGDGTLGAGGLETSERDSTGPTCGNGVLDPVEMCDDGNLIAYDGCTRICQIELGYVCPVVGQPCLRIDGGDPGG